MNIPLMGSESMSVSDMINNAIAVKGFKKKDVAAQMGWSPQNFTNRLKLGTIDAEEWVKLSKILGYEIRMIDLGNGATLKLRKQSSSPRVVQQIDGYTYDTKNADAICHTPKLYGGWFELFKDIQNNKFFTVAYLETGGSSCMALISESDAKQFYIDCGGETPEEIFDC